MHNPQTFDTLTRRQFFSRAALGTLGAAAALSGASTLVQHWPTGAPAGDWPRFTRELATTLPTLDWYAFLVLESKVYYVQFCEHEGALRMEAVSNQFLDDGDRLSAWAHRALLAAGWTAPSFDGGHPGQAPGGSPNYFRHVRPPVAFDDVAALATRTLQAIYGVAHPTALTHDAGYPYGTAIRLPTLALARTGRGPRA